MDVLEKYNSELDRLKAEQRELALQALERGEEREYSVHLMQASMMGDMLKVLGKVQHEGSRPQYIPNMLAALEREEKAQKEAGDYDLADRACVKARTIRQAMAILERLEKENA